MVFRVVPIHDIQFPCGLMFEVLRWPSVAGLASLECHAAISMFLNACTGVGSDTPGVRRVNVTASGHMSVCHASGRFVRDVDSSRYTSRAIYSASRLDRRSSVRKYFFNEWRGTAFSTTTRGGVLIGHSPGDWVSISWLMSDYLLGIGIAVLVCRCGIRQGFALG